MGDKNAVKTRKFIEVLQKDALGEIRGQDMLDKAVELGYEIGKCLIEANKDPV